MLEGAVAYFQATGRRRLLDVMEKYVDHIGDTFGRAKLTEALASKAITVRQILRIVHIMR